MITIGSVLQRENKWGLIPFYKNFNEFEDKSNYSIFFYLIQVVD